MRQILWNNIHSRIIRLKTHRSVLTLTVLVSILVFSVGYSIYQSRSAPIDRAKIGKLITDGIDCKKGINAVRRMHTTKNDAEGSISLLSYRANCLVKLEQYKESLNAYSQLQEFYGLSHDANRVELVEDQIDKVNRLIANPPKDSEISTPESQKTLEEKPRG